MQRFFEKEEEKQAGYANLDEYAVYARIVRNEVQLAAVPTSLRTPLMWSASL
jgi:hypothetical protein